MDKKQDKIHGRGPAIFRHLTVPFYNILAKLLIFDTPKRAFLIDMDSIIMCNDFAPFASKFKSL